MWHTILNIYGPFSIHSYGLMIALGLLIFLYLIKKNSRFAALQLEDRFTAILLVGIIAGLVGGRILFVLSNPEPFSQLSDLLLPWQGGFSLLGTIIAVIIVLPLYLAKLKIPILRFLDLIAIYAPILQAVARIGCFLSGCCHGIPTTQPWGITYTDLHSAAPLYVCLHPTQIYSAIGMLVIFALMYFVFQHRCSKPGQLISVYVIAISIERFIVDFWRGDTQIGPLFSFNQQIAIGLCIAAIIGLIIATLFPTRRS